jgi:hypothetical protein
MTTPEAKAQCALDLAHNPAFAGSELIVVDEGRYGPIDSLSLASRLSNTAAVRLLPLAGSPNCEVSANAGLTASTGSQVVFFDARDASLDYWHMPRPEPPPSSAREASAHARDHLAGEVRQSVGLAVDAIAALDAYGFDPIASYGIARLNGAKRPKPF